MKDGDPFRGNAIEKSIDSLTYIAGIAGYAFVDIRPQIEADPCPSSGILRQKAA